jgi:hypothetical protein
VIDGFGQDWNTIFRGDFKPETKYRCDILLAGPHHRGAEKIQRKDPDYYLLSFSDDELLDLVRNPDEWGPLDYVLAKQILASHGKPISPEQEVGFQAERIRTLAQPEESKRRCGVRIFS